MRYYLTPVRLTTVKMMKDICTSMFIAVLFTKNKKTSKQIVVKHFEIKDEENT